jgi:hypothetical protein
MCAASSGVPHNAQVSSEGPCLVAICRLEGSWSKASCQANVAPCESFSYMELTEYIPDDCRDQLTLYLSWEN